MIARRFREATEVSSAGWRRNSKFDLQDEPWTFVDHCPHVKAEWVLDEAKTGWPTNRGYLLLPIKAKNLRIGFSNEKRELIA